jgi:cation transporter-like permease
MKALTTRIAVSATLLVLGVVTGQLLQDRAARLEQRRPGREAGFTTIEWVVIALGLFLIAGVAVAAINAVVNNRLGQIS